MADVYAAHRPGYVAGLRMLADLLDTRPEMPTPTTGLAIQSNSTINMHVVNGADPAPILAALTEVAGRPVAAEVRESSVWLTWHLAGLSVLVSAPVTKVCERTVTGTIRTRGQVREVIEWMLPAHLDPTLPDNGPAPVVWDDSAAPGGYVCAAPAGQPDGQSLICGMPVESEPCPYHGQTADAPGEAAAEVA